MNKPKKKFRREPITMICLKLVESHESRKFSIESKRTKRIALEQKIKSITITDMPNGGGLQGVSDPVHEVYSKIEELDRQIKIEQRRVDAVEYAIDRIGFYEQNPEDRKKMREAILMNIQMGGHEMPFEYLDYPQQYDRNKFYSQRKAFLMDIANQLDLVLES